MSRQWLWLAYLAVLVLIMAAGVGLQLPWLELPLTEVLYKGFLLFYGLVFPLYLLLGRRRPLFLGALLLTVLPYSAGFLLGGDWLVALSLSMAVVAGFVGVRGFRRERA